MIKITYIDGKTDIVEGEYIKQFKGDTFIEDINGLTVAKIPEGKFLSIIKNIPNEEKVNTQITVADLAIKAGYTGVRFSWDGTKNWYATLRAIGRNPKVFKGESFLYVHDLMVKYVQTEKQPKEVYGIWKHNHFGGCSDFLGFKSKK